jgi:hypothetical protein
MRTPLYITGYDDKAEKRGKRASYLAREVNWAERVPTLWRSLTIGPLWVDVNRDQEAGAERWIGYDEEEQPCYCRYQFQVPIGAMGGGMSGTPEAEQVYKEDLAGWRMRDDRWLIHRIITCQTDGVTSYSFYAFSESMPR